MLASPSARLCFGLRSLVRAVRPPATKPMPPRTTRGRARLRATCGCRCTRPSRSGPYPTYGRRPGKRGTQGGNRDRWNGQKYKAAVQCNSSARSSAQCSSATQQRDAAARAATCVVTRAAAYAARAATSRSRRDLAWEGGAWECGMGGRRMEVWHGRAAHGSVTWEGGAWKCGMGGRRARVGTLTCG